jgi:uncharacterized protein YgiM (DUF1202 family)
MLRSPLFLTAITSLVLLSVLASTGCTEQREVLGQAYVAPASLNVRSQLSQKSGTVAKLKHGDLVSIIDVQRRLVRVRTAAGFEGWVDSLELLSPEQMNELRGERQQDLALPAEGSATAFETLNIHLQPNRSSPAFAQIPEGGTVTILGRRVAPKTAGPLRSQLLLGGRAQPSSRRRRKEPQTRSSFRLPPKPPPPKPPANWQELSAERIDGAPSTKDLKLRRDGDTAAKAKSAIEPSKPVVMEDWTLVRTKANDVGWVLTRNLMMSIPDEVAQYAEGKHITSFFDLGAVTDEKKGVKHNWLWTTSAGLSPYDFDSWRVFLWNARRHRYETSYRQHDLEGYFPVRVDAANAGSRERTFQLITKDDDGNLRRRSYLFDGSRVHLTATEKYQSGAETNLQKAAGVDTDKLHSKALHTGWFRRQWSAWKRRFSGGH